MSSATWAPGPVAPVTAIPDDLDRIVALPRRPPLNCERDRWRRWDPEAQALVEVVTARYTRGSRLSCGCLPRHVEALGGGRLVVRQAPRPHRPGTPPPIPPSPLEMTVEAFCRDNILDKKAVERVSGLHATYTADLPGIAGGAGYCLTELNPVQAWALWEVARAGGIFGMCSVGSGKTLLGFLVPLAVPTCKTAVVFIKPQQRLHYRTAYLRLREHFRVPTVIFDKTMLEDSNIVPGTPSTHVVPYSLLSNTQSTQLLELINPDTVIADEGHLLANKKSSRTMRFMRFMAARGATSTTGGVVFCVWSGSMINKSIRDCAHLATHSLGWGSPYPISPNTVEAWAAVIDPIAMPDRKSQTATRLREEFGTRTPVEKAFFVSSLVSDDGVREGFRDRAVATLGVVSTKSSSINCSLTISERRAPKLPDAVLRALVDVRTLNVRPDGEELVESTEIAACIHTVIGGHYYYWVFKHPCMCPPDWDTAFDGTERRCDECKRIARWFAARKAWNKELRVKLQNGEPHLDSMALCENAAERAWRDGRQGRPARYTGDLPVWPAAAWPAWAEVKDTVNYEPRTRWIDDYLAQDAATWARENCGVVWCKASPFGQLVAKLAGIPYYGGGEAAEAALMTEDGSRSIVVSIPARGESLDGLQFHFHKQLITEFPPSGKGAEQLLGRLARVGQKADTVETEVYRHVAEYREDIEKAIEYARFDQEMTPNAQLILSADFDFEVGSWL